MLKLIQQARSLPNLWPQPPSGGCVLKLLLTNLKGNIMFQPPSGGCVLKPEEGKGYNIDTLPAAFGRLCVETHLWNRL